VDAAEAVHKLIARGVGREIRVQACGGRKQAFDKFVTALQLDTTTPILLVDAEAPVADIEDPWAHLKTRDGWAMPAGTDDDHAFLMVQAMETWLLADPRRARIGGRKGIQTREDHEVGITRGGDQRADERCARCRDERVRSALRQGHTLLQRVGANWTPKRAARWARQARSGGARHLGAVPGVQPQMLGAPRRRKSGFRESPTPRRRSEARQGGLRSRRTISADPLKALAGVDATRLRSACPSATRFFDTLKRL
jgi:hypothetical protein